MRELPTVRSACCSSGAHTDEDPDFHDRSTGVQAYRRTLQASGFGPPVCCVCGSARDARFISNSRTRVSRHGARFHLSAQASTNKSHRSSPSNQASCFMSISIVSAYSVHRFFFLPPPLLPLHRHHP
ncbi:hypothetical protein BU23DRAFT_333426 [Bimuria novae-zelandiae CBS 107.79]|uniref:Uncharacterized protein n=1 Tax=Bimuria novae-zelandiae CBS 107.79 TaxID=1447943 RepID=A0A6A5UN02_9PLEO|nr:hypothetical protein BU23DRAFT_333426 [Bimuria novae-zelandiae CBS 107.79]